MDALQLKAGKAGKCEKRTQEMRKGKKELETCNEVTSGMRAQRRNARNETMGSRTYSRVKNL